MKIIFALTFCFVGKSEQAISYGKKKYYGFRKKSHTCSQNQGPASGKPQNLE
jgi:hypothetical protein